MQDAYWRPSRHKGFKGNRIESNWQGAVGDSSENDWGTSGWFTTASTDYDAQVAAAAAAAVEQPSRKVLQQKTERNILDAINAAQSEAAHRRRNDFPDNLPPAPGSPGKARAHMAKRGDPKVDSMIRGAQIAARGERRRAAPGEPLTPEDFLGNWVDKSGNSVLVYSVDAYDVRLLVTLSRYPRPDVHLTLRQTFPGAWTCGNSALSTEMSSPLQLVWVGADGRMSTWTRGRG